MDLVLRLSSGLSKLGLSPGEVVVVVSGNTAHYWLLVMAVWLCGGCVSPACPAIWWQELQRQVEDSGAAVVVCDETNIGTVGRIRRNCGRLRQGAMAGRMDSPFSCLSINADF